MQHPTQPKNTVLAVDDDEVNLEILVKTAGDAGFNVKAFSNGKAAREYLYANPKKIDIVLLDKMMPGVGGMELLADIKRHPVLRRIPVILETGDAGMKQLCDGLDSGAFYYLMKPFAPEVLTSILQAANNECILRRELLSQMSAGYSLFLSMLNDAEFIFNTHSKARLLAVNLAQLSNNPEFVARGLMELFANAIEHGSLGIGFAQKKAWLLSKCWEKELLARMHHPHYQNKMVRVQVQRILSSIQVSVIDQGEGFSCGDFLTTGTKDLINQSSGRGITIARKCLDEVQYNPKGNEVTCTIKLQHADIIPVNDTLSVAARH